MVVAIAAAMVAVRKAGVWRSIAWRVEIIAVSSGSHADLAARLVVGDELENADLGGREVAESRRHASGGPRLPSNQI